MLMWLMNLGFAGGGAIEEFFSGGYHPWIYIPRVKYKFKDEEEKKVAKIVEEVTERQIEITGKSVTTRDLEIAVRLNLRLQGLIFKQLYMQWIRSEVKKIRAFQKEQRNKKRRRQEIEIVILMLH